MKNKIKLIVLAFVLIMSSCTEQQRAKKFGSSVTIELNKGQRLVTCSWKENNLWLLVKKDTTKPTSYVLKESSSWGILEGEVTIIEK